MITVGEWKKALADKPDDMPVSMTHTADDGTVTVMRVAADWVAQKTYCVEFETKSAEEVSNA